MAHASVIRWSSALAFAQIHNPYYGASWMTSIPSSSCGHACSFGKLVPGANVVVASNPLVSHLVSTGAVRWWPGAPRGDCAPDHDAQRRETAPRPLTRSFTRSASCPARCGNPGLLYRKPVEGRVQDNLRAWRTGGFRRPGPDRPFGDVISSAPTRKAERDLAPHPSLKPQLFLRYLVRSVLPTGEGTILDPFAGAGSTLAAAEAVGYKSVGVEKDEFYFDMAREAIPKLARFSPNGQVR